jgi:hypothetical protein
MTKKRECYINSCYNYPIIISGDSTLYTTIQSGYNALPEGKTAQIHAALFNENLYLDIAKAVTLHGGYNCHYTADSEFTVVKGSLTVSNGTVTVNRIKIK